MSQMTKEINKITKTIIGISGKLILYALVILLLAEGMTKGYAFGYSIFYATPMEAAPGRDFSVTIPEGQTPRETIATLKDLGLIENELAVQIQMKFYDYEIYPGTYKLNTSMTSKEILQLLNEKPAAEESSTDTQTPESGSSSEQEESAAGNDAESIEDNDPENAADNTAEGSADNTAEDAAGNTAEDAAGNTAEGAGEAAAEDSDVRIETGGTE